VSSIGLTLAIFEGILRLVVYSVAVRYSYDPSWGNQVTRGSAIHWALEGSGTTRYLVDGEVATPFLDGTSVVVVGDSHSEARQVDDDQNFISVAERQLRQSGRPVDLHNLGQNGFTVPDYIFLAPLLEQRYHPSVTVIEIWVKNFDVANTFDSSQSNHFVSTPDGSLALRHTPPKNLNTRAGNLRRSLTLVDYGLKRVDDLRSSIVERVRQLVRLRAPGESPAKAPYLAAGAAITALEVKALQDAYAGQKVVIVLLPTGPHLDDGRLVTEPPPDEAELLALLQAVPGWRVVYPADEFTHLVETGALPRGFANTVPGSGHLNVAGHRIVGTQLANALKDLIP
jgi:hypothetical protein